MKVKKRKCVNWQLGMATLRPRLYFGLNSSGPVTNSADRSNIFQLGRSGRNLTIEDIVAAVPCLKQEMGGTNSDISIHDGEGRL